MFFWHQQQTKLESIVSRYQHLCCGLEEANVHIYYISNILQPAGDERLSQSWLSTHQCPQVEPRALKTCVYLLCVFVAIATSAWGGQLQGNEGGKHEAYVGACVCSAWCLPPCHSLEDSITCLRLAVLLKGRQTNEQIVWNGTRLFTFLSFFFFFNLLLLLPELFWHSPFEVTISVIWKSYSSLMSLLYIGVCVFTLILSCLGDWSYTSTHL